MRKGELLRKRRAAYGIPGSVLCRKAAIWRSRLCGIERGHIDAPESELQRLFAALDELVAVRREVQKLALRMGWPGATQILMRGDQEVST